MQSFLTTFSATTLALALAASHADAQTKAELVSTRMIWNGAPRNVAVDLVRFKDRWWVVCQESTDLYSQDGALRVLASDDAEKWESVALLKSPTPGKGLSDPKFTLKPNGQLMISALGIVPTLNVPDPLPRWGGTVQTMAWFSPDGRTWSRPEEIGLENYPFCRVAWNEDVAWSYACGCICGSMQTVQFFSSKDGKRFQSQFQQTFSGFFPDDGAIIFAGDQAYCLMSRFNATIDNARQPGLLGTAKAPYTEWEWKDLDTRISVPNLLRLPDQRIIAAVGLVDGKARTSLCEFDPATGKLTELLELPTDGGNVHVGLAMHNGHLWVSYPATHEGKWCAHLAQVKLK